MLKLLILLAIAGIPLIGISLILPNYDILINEKMNEISWQQTEKTNCPNEQCNKALDNTIKTLEGIKSGYENWKLFKNALFILGIILLVLPAIPKVYEYIMAIF